MKRITIVLAGVSVLAIFSSVYKTDWKVGPVPVFHIPAGRNSPQDIELRLIADYRVPSDEPSSASDYSRSLVSTVTNLAWTHDSEYLAAFTSLGSVAHMLDFRDKKPDSLGHSRTVSTPAIFFSTVMGRTFFIGNTHTLLSPHVDPATLRINRSAVLTTLNLDTSTVGTVDGPQAKDSNGTWEVSASLDGNLVAYTTVRGGNLVVYRNRNWAQPETYPLPKVSSVAKLAPDFDRSDYTGDIDTDTLSPLKAVSVSASGHFIAVALWHVFLRPDGSKDGPVFVGVLNAETNRLISLGRCPGIGGGSLDDLQFAPEAGEGEIVVATQHSTLSPAEQMPGRAEQAQVGSENSQSCILDARTGKVRAVLPSGSSGTFMASWSILGSIVTDWDRKGVLAVDTRGTRFRVLSEPADVQWEEWSPDGKYLALAWNDHVSVYGVSSGISN